MDIGELRCPDCDRPMTPVACVCAECGMRVEGELSTSVLSLLPARDQALVIAFLRSYGSIKRIQELLGVSYPTARARLAGVIERLDGIMEAPEGDRNRVLGKLESGEITFEQALELL